MSRVSHGVLESHDSLCFFGLVHVFMFNNFSPINKYWLIFSPSMIFLYASSAWQTSQLSFLNVLAYPVLSKNVFPNVV